MPPKKSKEPHKKREQPQAETIKTGKPTVRILTWLLAICTLLGGLSAALTFLPRVIIAPSDPVDVNNPFSVSFTVTNASLIPITLNEVDVRVFLGQVLAEPLPFEPPKTLNVGSGGLARPEWSGHRLQMDERFTVTLEGIFGLASGVPPYLPARLSGADVAMVVTYKPWIIPVKREKAFRFVTRRQSNGALYWYSAPLD